MGSVADESYHIVAGILSEVWRPSWVETRGADLATLRGVLYTYYLKANDTLDFTQEFEVGERLPVSKFDYKGSTCGRSR